MEIRLIFIYFQVVLSLCTFFLRSAASTRSHSRFPIMIFLSACIGSLRSRYFVFVNEKRAVTGIETLGLTITKIRVKLKLNRGYVDLNSELNLFILFAFCFAIALKCEQRAAAVQNPDASFAVLICHETSSMLLFLFYQLPLCERKKCATIIWAVKYDTFPPHTLVFQFKSALLTAALLMQAFFLAVYLCRCSLWELFYW